MSLAAVSTRADLGLSANLAPSRSSVAPEGGSELNQLQARAEAGFSLSPVEAGTLARLMDEAGAGLPQAANDDAEEAGGPKTVDDFTVTGATKQDIADLKETLAYLQQTDAKGVPVSQTATDLLAELPEGSEIHIVHDGGDQYDPSTGVIDWDPRSGLTVTSGEGTQSAALGLIHEIDHEVHGLDDPRPTGDGYDNTEEKRVITGSETTIAHDLHEPTRTDHYGETKVMDSSIAHTEVEHQAAVAPAKAEPSIFERVLDFFRNLF